MTGESRELGASEFTRSILELAILFGFHSRLVRGISHCTPSSAVWITSSAAFTAHDTVNRWQFHTQKIPVAIFGHQLTKLLILTFTF